MTTRALPRAPISAPTPAPVPETCILEPMRPNEQHTCIGRSGGDEPPETYVRPVSGAAPGSASCGPGSSRPRGLTCSQNATIPDSSGGERTHAGMPPSATRTPSPGGAATWARKSAAASPGHHGPEQLPDLSNAGGATHPARRPRQTTNHRGAGTPLGSSPSVLCEQNTSSLPNGSSMFMSVFRPRKRGSTTQGFG